MGVNEIIRIGDRIKEVRHSRGLTQREIAEKLDIPISSYSNYENNNREPNIDMIKNIALVLDVSVAYLVGWDDFFENKQLRKENSFYNFLYSLGYEFEIHDSYTYHVNYKGITYEISLDESLKLLNLISKYSNYIVDDFLKTAKVLK